MSCIKILIKPFGNIVNGRFLFLINPWRVYVAEARTSPFIY